MKIQNMTVCKECDKPFEKRKKWQLFCKKTCRTANWEKKHPRIDLIKLNRVIDKK